MKKTKKGVNNKWIIIAVVAVVIIAAVIYLNLPATTITKPMEEDQKIGETDRGEAIFQTAEGEKYIIHPDRLQRGIALPGDIRDVIPAIDNPKFISVSEADKYIEDNELVMVLEYKGVKRVYPLQILVWHEIVNDIVAGDPLVITWCPLCGSALAFERTIGGKVLDFGTSGKLFNSDLVMYDRQTNSYWTQIGGQAIIGEMTGTELKLIDIEVVVWGDWKTFHPDSEVLSRDTGYSRQYGRDPYGNYYESSQLFFPVETQDGGLHPKTVVFAIGLNGEYKAYREDDLKDLGTIEDTFAGVNLKIERDEAGRVTFTNLDTNEEIPKEREFWFAWFAFHPDTELYEK